MRSDMGSYAIYRVSHLVRTGSPLVTRQPIQQQPRLEPR